MLQVCCNNTDVMHGASLLAVRNGKNHFLQQQLHGRGQKRSPGNNSTCTPDTSSAFGEYASNCLEHFILLLGEPWYIGSMQDCRLTGLVINPAPGV